MVAEGKPIKAIAAARARPPEAVDAEVEALFVKLAEGVSAGTEGALRRLRLLHQCIVDREEQGETLSRLLPGGLAEKLRTGRPGHRGDRAGRGDRADERHPLVLHHRRTRRPEPAGRAAQHPPGRHEPGHPGRGRDGHAVRRRRGHGRLRRAVLPARPRRPRRWPPPPMPIGCRPRSTPAWERGRPARPSASGSGCRPARRPPPCSGSEERLEYTLVGDTVNLSQRLQQLAESGRDCAEPGDHGCLGHPGGGDPVACAAGQRTGHAGPCLADFRQDPKVAVLAHADRVDGPG